jgi:hypothetical protein
MFMTIGLTGVVEGVGRNLARTALQAEPAGDTHHGTHRLRMLAEVDLLPERKLRVEMLQCDSSTRERLDQGELDRAELITAAEIDLDVAGEPIKQLGRVGSAVELLPG